MAGLPDKPVLELNQGIEVEGAMDTEKEISGAQRNDPNVKHVEFKSPDIVEYTGEKESPDKEQEEQEEQASQESEPQSDVDGNLLELRKMMGMETKAEKEAENNPPEETEQEEAEQIEEVSEDDGGEVKDSLPEERPKKRLRRKDPVPSMEDMAKLAGQAAAEALKKSNDDSLLDSEPDQLNSPSLDNEDQLTYEVFKQMEGSNPSKYKGVKEQFVNFVEASKNYQKDWIARNPGETFDPESEEHASFYEQNEPKYSQVDFKKAERRVEMEEVIGDVEKKYQSKIDELEDKLSNRAETQPVAQDKANEAIQDLVKEISPEMAGILSEKGLEEAEKSDPLVFDKVSAAAETLGSMVYEIQQNSDKSGTFSGNSRNETHKVVAEFLSEREKYVKSLPSESQRWNGKSFATNSEYKKMSVSDKKNYWTIDSNLLTKELIKELSGSVNAEIEQSRKMLERYGAAPAGKKTRAKQKNSTKNPNKPNSPSSDAASASSPNLTTGTDQIKTPEKELAEMLWG